MAIMNGAHRHTAIVVHIKPSIIFLFFHIYTRRASVYVGTLVYDVWHIFQALRAKQSSAAIFALFQAAGVELSSCTNELFIPSWLYENT